MVAVVVEATAAMADCSGVSPAQICSGPERDGSPDKDRRDSGGLERQAPAPRS